MAVAQPQPPQVPTLAWEVKPPSSWPAPPPRMSVSTLAAIEDCPRRWALGHASYPDVWTGLGYPPSVSEGALEGNVVHTAIERIVKALVAAGCSSVSDASFVSTLLALGGYR